MHPNSTCRFGLCRQPGTRLVTTRTAIGRRVELLCQQHRDRRAAIEQVLDDVAIDDPIPYSLTDAGRAGIASPHRQLHSVTSWERKLPGK
jgi:hypothetical protein